VSGPDFKPPRIAWDEGEKQEERLPRGERQWVDNRHWHSPKGPRPKDETEQEREEAAAQMAKERINPVFASEFIDGYIRRCS